MRHAHYLKVPIHSGLSIDGALKYDRLELPFGFDLPDLKYFPRSGQVHVQVTLH